MSGIPPIDESVTATPAVAAQPEPAPSSGVVVAAAPVETPSPAAEAPAAAPDVVMEHGETLLQKFAREEAEKEAAKPAAAPVVADPAAPAVDPNAVPVVADPAAPIAPEPVAYEYALPEKLVMDDALKGEVHAALDAFRADPSKGAQGLLDLHAKTMDNYAQQLVREQWNVFNAARREWITEVMADPQLGGSGFQTSMGQIARMRDKFVADADKEAFETFLQVTGAGDHPQFLKLLHNVARAFDEPSLPPPNPKPTPNNGQPPKRGMRDIYNPK